MQGLVDEKKAANEKNLLRVVSDAQCISVLRSFGGQAKSVSQLNHECNINAGTLYRKLKLLQKSGLLETSYKITPNGKKFFLYKSLVKNFAILFADNKLEVNLVLDGGKGYSERDSLSKKE